MKRIALIAAAALTLTAGIAHAQMKPEEVLKARQGLFQAVKMNFGPLKAVAEGSAPLDAAAVAKAENLAALTKIIPATFAKGTESIPGSNTKPEAWTSADFGKGAEMFQMEAAKLAEAAKAGNQDAFKAQFAAVGKTCKSCHDNFKKD